MSSVGGGLAVAVAAVAAAVGKAATRYHGEGDQDMHPKYSTRGETETDRKHWDHKGSWGSGGPLWQ